MRSLASIVFLHCLFALSSCRVDPLYECRTPPVQDTISLLTHFDYASCGRQNKPEPILYKIVEDKPQLFLFLGDNIYGDTEDMREMKVKYGELSCKAEFQALWQSCPIIAIWDDHDLGHNDSGSDYPKKAESKQVFMDFWNEPMNSPRRQHSGLYMSYYYGDSAHRVQIILLDNRTFRSNILEDANGYYIPDPNPASTMLGAEQWTWLKDELSKPARIRFIGSSTQFGGDYYGGEAWANFPNEVEKMFNTIRETHAEGVVFLSGDTHFAELSMQSPAGIYPIYDLTSSSINQPRSDYWGNAFRVGDVFIKENFGSIDIDWNASDPIIHLKIIDKEMQTRISHDISLSELKF